MLFGKLLEWIFPQNLNCVICELPISKKNKYSLCRNCYEELFVIQNPCVKCGKPQINLNLDEGENILNCDYCKSKRFLFDRNISFVEYNKLSKKMVFGLKYGKKTYMARHIAGIMGDVLNEKYPEILEEMDYLLFVPLNKKRQRKRGFNQTEKIASYLEKYIGVKSLDALKRNKNTKRLYKLKPKERQKEVLNAFEVKEEYEALLEGANILLLDDIFTTGSTINEISKTLRLNGVEKIVSITFLTGRYEKNI